MFLPFNILEELIVDKSAPFVTSQPSCFHNCVCHSTHYLKSGTSKRRTKGTFLISREFLLWQNPGDRNCAWKTNLSTLTVRTTNRLCCDVINSAKKQVKLTFSENIFFEKAVPFFFYPLRLGKDSNSCTQRPSEADSIDDVFIKTESNLLAY